MADCSGGNKELLHVMPYCALMFEGAVSQNTENAGVIMNCHGDRDVAVQLDDTYYGEDLDVLTDYTMHNGEQCDIIVGGGYDSDPAKNFACLKVPDRIEDLVKTRSEFPDDRFLPSSF